MTLAAYGDYKYSGDKWLGDVPSHWQILPLKHMAEVDNSGTYGKDPEEGQNLLPVATTAQIDALGNFVTSKMSLRSFTNEELRRYACSSGDILVVKSSGSAENIISGKAGIVRADTPRFVFSNFLMRLRCNANRCLSPYLYSLIVSHITRERVKQMCSTTTYPNLQVPLYVGAKLPCPPMAEQKKIALFLDHETAKIDALIREQERLIELLQEKRQAVISHAVTKGLDPDVPMKDSGVEWLGEVPAHWDVMPLKWRAISRSGDGLASQTIESAESPEKSIPVIGGNGVMGYISEANLQPPAIVLGRVGALCGNVHTITEPAWVTDNALIIQFDDWAFDGSYLSNLLRARNLNEIADRTAQPLITGSKVRDQFIVIPPLSEQKAINVWLEDNKKRFDNLLSESDRLISVLKERRAALISAAVTGKIDVRNWQPPSDESAFDEDVRQAGMEVTA